MARDFGHEEIFQFLMEHSPEDVKLSQAFELGDENIFRTLLAKRPNLIETFSDHERRQLPDAAQNNNTDAVRLMLKAGWPVDTRGEYGLTALQWGAWHGNAGMVREVLRYRPDVELQDCEHEIPALGSALHGSENSWHRDTGDYAATVEALIEAGAKPPKLTQIWKRARRSAKSSGDTRVARVKLWGRMLSMERASPKRLMTARANSFSRFCGPIRF